MDPSETEHPDRPAKPTLFKAVEWRNIVVILGLATATLFAIGYLFTRNERFATTLLSSIGLHVVGARAPAFLLCLSRDMSPATTFLFNLYVEGIIVVLCYYSFVLVIREGLESKFLRLAAKQAEHAAQEHRDLLQRFEHFGLFLLVMAPLPMTGPVTGALVGYLLNLKPWVTFSIVLAGTSVALGTYVILGRAILAELIAFQVENKVEVEIVLVVVIAIFTIYHVRTIAKWVQNTASESEE